jgi:hypothetical protein
MNRLELSTLIIHGWLVHLSLSWLLHFIIPSWCRFRLPRHTHFEIYYAVLTLRAELKQYAAPYYDMEW